MTALLAREHPEEALRVPFVEKRHHEPAADRRRAVRRGEVAGERHLDRPGAAVVREAHPRDVVRLGLGQADGRHHRRAAPGRDERDRAVRARALARQLEGAQHRLGVVLEVGGAERRRRLEGGDRVVQRLRERREPLVVAAQHRHGDVRLAGQQAPEREHEEDERDGGECDRRHGQLGGRHAHAGRASIEVTL